MPTERRTRTKPPDSTRPVRETTRAYLFVAATLLVALGLGLLAVQSGAIDTLNASSLLRGRS